MQRLLCLLLAVLTLCFGSCARSATQLLVVVDSDFPAPTRMAKVRVTMLLPDGRPVPESTQTYDLLARGAPNEATRFSLPLSFGVAAGTSPRDGQVRVRVEGLSSTETVLVERELRARYVPGKTLRVPVYLARICGGEDCNNNDRTCREFDANCHSVDLRPEETPELPTDTPVGGELRMPVTSSTTAVLEPIEDAEQIFTGQNFACTLRGGRVWCWGENSGGGLGRIDGSALNGAAPVLTINNTPLDQITTVALGLHHGCALRMDRSLWCWGNNFSGAVGIGSSNAQTLATPVPMMNSMVTSVAAGTAHTCAVQNGQVFCWGLNSLGQVGTGTMNNEVRSPTLVAGVADAVEVVAGWDYSCARTANGEVFCWGSNERGQIGPGVPVNSNSRVPVPVLSDARALFANGYITAALKNTGELLVWGTNESGVFGAISERYITTPTLLPIPTSIGAIDRVSIGVGHFCVRATNGSFYCSGSNNYGELGTGTATSGMPIRTLTPVAFPLETLSAGNDATCGINAGVPKCWGSAGENIVGNGGGVPSARPVRVGALATSS